MAVIAFTKAYYGDNTIAFTWAGVTQADTFLPLGPAFADYADRSIQITGTFGGATVILKGSNDGTNYEPLTDPQGNAISKTLAGTTLEAISEATLFVQPTHGGGAGETISVILVCRRSRSGQAQ